MNSLSKSFPAAAPETEIPSQILDIAPHLFGPIARYARLQPREKIELTLEPDTTPVQDGQYDNEPKCYWKIKDRKGPLTLKSFLSVWQSKPDDILGHDYTTKIINSERLRPFLTLHPSLFIMLVSFNREDGNFYRQILYPVFPDNHTTSSQ